MPGVPELATLGVVLLMLIGVGFRIRADGKNAERVKNLTEIEDALLKVGKVERDVAREPDPVGKLQDEWRRP